MSWRTDLALEAAETLEEVLSPEDFEKECGGNGGVTTTRIRIKSGRAAEQIGKPPGTYVTVEVPPLTDNDEQLERYAQTVAEELTALLPEEGAVLVVGLGNAAVTPDALGPETADMVLATRHIEGEFARSAGLTGLRAAAVMVPGVLGQTGIESGDMIRGVCGAVQPAAVIVVDALAARSLSRLGCTVQLCDTGIAPGSGVGNNRRPVSPASLGVPVIGMGVPTVVDAAVIANELTGAGETESPAAGMMVTPREVDLLIARASRLTAMAINAALQPDYSPLELIAVARS
ncbi:MAG: GPR endopeptidase [Oscillospiraceae bacterium]|nr:GPR endopeptidase [Oscillospiraceae bacterium]